MTVRQQLEAAIENFIRQSMASRSDGPRASGRDDRARSAVFIDEAEPRLSRAFLLDAIEREMRAAERRIERDAEPAPEDGRQMKFVAPGFAQLFTSVRQRLPLAAGRGSRTVELENMTVTQIRRAAAVLEQRAKRRGELDARRAEYLKRIADEMSPVSRTHYKLTYGHYLDLVADGVVKPAAKAKAAQ